MIDDGILLVFQHIITKYEGTVGSSDDTSESSGTTTYHISVTFILILSGSSF